MKATRESKRVGQAWELAGDYSVEIWFPIAKDDDGYPQIKELGAATRAATTGKR